MTDIKPIACLPVLMSYQIGKNPVTQMRKMQTARHINSVRAVYMLGGDPDPLTCNVDALTGSPLQTHWMIFRIVSVTSSVANG